jgi:hypothetical protein
MMWIIGILTSQVYEEKQMKVSDEINSCVGNRFTPLTKMKEVWG